MLEQLSPDLSDDLKKYFPDCFREIRAIALLWFVEGVFSTRILQTVFEQSYLSQFCPDLALSEGTVQKFVLKLGSMQDRINSFLREYITPQMALLFDGTSIFLNFGDFPAGTGYNALHSRDPQVRLLYVFEKKSHKLLFYTALQESIIDKSAFLDVADQYGCSDCILIGNKGFYSKRNISALLGHPGLKFILPLQYNIRVVRSEFFEDPNYDKFDGSFSYHGGISGIAKSQAATRATTYTSFWMSSAGRRNMRVLSNAVGRITSNQHTHLWMSSGGSAWAASALQQL